MNNTMSLLTVCAMGNTCSFNTTYRE